MLRQILALALCLATGLGAAPAGAQTFTQRYAQPQAQYYGQPQANGGAQIAGAVAALLALGLIAKTYENRRDDRRESRRRDQRDDRRERDLRDGRAIPASCVVLTDRGSRPARVVGPRCLAREGHRGRLPERCAREVRVGGHRTLAYGLPCLRKAGFAVR